MTKKRRIPIGLSDFKEMIEENYYYVDKSLLIQEIMEDGSKVILLPRPRRFGKTLNMSMLRYFYEKTEEDHGSLFQGLQIWEQEAIRSEQGKRPVIYLTFKDVKYNRWEDCLSSFKSVFAYLYNEHRVILEGDVLTSSEKEYVEDVIWKRADLAELGNSVLQLCQYLYRYHGEKPIILIDEYDTPLYSAWGAGYYNELISFIRNLLGAALKDNLYLEKAVLTGIMRVAKESIFSGLNNLNVATLLQSQYSDKFGFLEAEVVALYRECGFEYDLSEVQSWYNGYVFGGQVIYNPWSILNYAHKHVDGLKPYWVNTGSSDLIRDLLTRADIRVKQELEDLIRGDELIKVIRDDTVLTDIGSSPETLWSFLLFSGYLKAVDTWMEGETTLGKLAIPNREVRYVYNEIIRYWTQAGVQEYDFKLMLRSLTTGDVKTFGKIFRDMVERSLSYFDVGGREPEKFYHAFVLGMMLTLMGEYEVKSNRESGYGRYDVMLLPLAGNTIGCVLEFKKVEDDEGETLETACAAALQQIADKGYRAELEAAGVKRILEVGIAFEGKRVKVMGRD